MPNLLAPIVEALLQVPATRPHADPGPADRRPTDSRPGDGDDERLAADVSTLTSAFLRALAGIDAGGAQTRAELRAGAAADPSSALARLYHEGLDRIETELAGRSADPEFSAILERAARILEQSAGDGARREAIWSVLFPQGTATLGHEAEREAELRARRRILLAAPAADPIEDPAREVLFTSNVLLTRPLTADGDARLRASGLAGLVPDVVADPQRHWYDHPIPLGIAPEANELLHGLRGLDDAIAFERRDGHATGEPVPVVLSVSVTHDGLHPAARPWVEAELRQAGGLRHVAPYVITERDVRRLVDEVLGPAWLRFAPVASTGAATDGASAFDVLGVDGPYGRHYSFLKAIAAVWHVTMDPAVRATFKIDLDQVFPQDVLVAETGRSAFGHLANPAWGGTGRDAAGRDVELGLIAGGLVNASQIDDGLFTPDVPAPRGPAGAHEWVFLSALPQAISTRGEINARYESPDLDGVGTMLERIHVTGGTNGIRVDALRRHRPFTPSFVGRAEDQAYILSVLDLPGPRLAYLHASGLVMRHDKEAYARSAIEAAEVGKLVGDDVRILVFSALVDLLERRGAETPGALGGPAVRSLLDPFTGSFASRLPATVVLLRFAFRLRDWAAGPPGRLRELATDGARRLLETLAFTADPVAFAAAVEAERTGWHRFYDTLDALEAAIASEDPDALALRVRARSILDACRAR